MTFQDQLENNFSQSVNKSSDIFKGLIKTIADNLQKAKNFCTYVSNMTDITKMKNDKSTNNKKAIGEILLYYLASFFAAKEMTAYEKENLVKKLKILFIRQNCQYWGSIPDILTIIKAFYNIPTVYLLENVDDPKNNLINGEFDTTTGWTFVNAGVSPEAAFQSSMGAYIKGLSNCVASYSIDNLEAGDYYLHLFAKAGEKGTTENSFSVSITIGNKQTTYTIFNQATEDKKKWNNYSVHFSVTTKSNVAFAFKAGGSTSNIVAYFDYIQLYKYVGYPTFSVVTLFDGGYSDSTFYFDKENGEHRQAEIGNSYFEGAKNVGIKSEIEFIVDYLRPVGVKAYIDTQFNTNNIQDDYVSEGILYTFSGDTSDNTYNSTDRKSVDDDIYDTNV